MHVDHGGNRVALVLRHGQNDAVDRFLGIRGRRPPEFMAQPSGIC